MIPRQSYFLFLVSFVLHTLASPTLHYCRHDQRDALMEFKHEFPLNESNSSSKDASLTSWNKSNDCCFWKGVTCGAKSGEVISLNLSYIPLNTSLKPNSGLFKLQHLRNLILIDCDLYGEIPSSLGNLSRLTLLELQSNKLVGEFPASVGNLTQLRVLSLSYNNFNGSIPVSLANLTKLSILDISGNQFTGDNIPLILANLTSLSMLRLNSNQFKSTLPLDMSGLQNLEYFDVSGNSFLGPFPTSLFTIPSLTWVYLRGNQFNGPIEFRNMSSSSSSLQYLDLSLNKFDGPIPKSISDFVNLETLSLSHNNFSGPIPKSISKLLNLNSLELSQGNFIGPIPTFLSKLVNLESLDLSNNKFEGQVPSFLWSVPMLILSHNSLSSFGKPSQVSNIQELDLSSNSFRGPLPQWICKLRSRVFLDFSNNSFNGSIPQCLENFLVFLRELSMHNNNFSGTLPDMFVNATNLLSVDVSGNQLEGKLPKSLIKCKELEFLSVERNGIKDKFPFWLASLPSLHVLILRSNQFYGPLYHPHLSIGFHSLKVVDISHNDFSGTLPPFYFSNWLEITTSTLGKNYPMYMEDPVYMDAYRISMEMVHKGVDTEFELIRNDFKAIDFSGNRFRGNIPESIGLLKGLRLLNLSGNAFTSSIPGSLANLTNLEALDLSRNHLSGQIPRDLGSLSFLSTMNFSHNNLQGPIPQGTQFQRQNCSSFMDNPKLNGLEDICGETHHVPNPTPQESEDSMSEPEEEVISWIAAAIAYVPGVFCGLVIGHIFASHKHEWFMEKFGRNKPRATVRSTR